MVDLFGNEPEPLEPIKEVSFVEEVADDEELTPRNNPELVGHDDLEQQFLNEYKAGRLPHAIILAGAMGIGKATMAYRLAKFLLANPEAPEDLYVDPNNLSYKRVASGGHADLLVIEREFDEKRGRFKNEISVDAVRRIHPFLQKTSAEGGWRIVIVDGAEALNRNSQNALLKVLEEPPKNTLLILTTSKPGAFLPTIKSRCRSINMQPLSDTLVSQLIGKSVPDASMQEQKVLTQVAAGSIGKAIEFYDAEGIEIYNQALEIVQSSPNLNMVKLHELADKFGKYGAERRYYTLIDIVKGWCENQARASARGQTMSDTLSNEGEVFSQLSGLYPKDHFLNAWEKITKLVGQIDSYNLDKRQGVIGTFMAFNNPKYKGLDI